MTTARNYVVKRKKSWVSLRRGRKYLSRAYGGSPTWTYEQRDAKRFTRADALAVARVFYQAIAVRLVKR